MNINIFLYIVLALAVFALIRELICWYFKANEQVKLQSKILDELIKLNSTGKED